MNVFLIGYRGTGKSSVARCLADRLGWKAVDADDELEQRAGRTIREIFASDGEVVFRELESAVVADLAAADRTVVALGGGAVLRPENRAALRDRGLVVWLQASAPVLAQRLAQDTTTQDRRPSLTPQGVLAEIEQLLAVREPLYRQCADLAIDAETRTPDEIADEIATRVTESAR